MLKERIIILLGCSCVAAGICGCKDRESKNFSAQGQETPIALLKKAHQAVTENDVESFLECYCGARGVQEAMTSKFEFGRTVEQFREKLKTRYGSGAWRTFDSIRPGDDYVTVKALPEDFDEWEQRIELREEGNRVVIMDPCDLVPAGIAYKEDGYWIFDPFRDEFSRGEFRAVQDWFIRMNRAVEMTMPHIDDPDADIRSIKELLSRNIKEQVIKRAK